MKTVEYYMNLPYTIELIKDPEGWFVRVKELEGCMSQGDTAEEAIEMIQEAMELWLEVSLEDGLPIPEPRPEEDYSGKFVVRVPRSLHRDLVEQAGREGTSLNQTINVALARAVGRPNSTSAAPAGEPGWPGLKPAVRQVLLAAGLAEEAGELDERLFASWADQCLNQVESAIAGGDVQKALHRLEPLARGLRAGQEKSPVVAGFCRAVLLLQRQIEVTIGLKQAASHDGMPHPGISPLSQRADGTLGQMVIHDEREPYAATLPGAEPRVEPPAEGPDTDQREQGRGLDRLIEEARAEFYSLQTRGPDKDPHMEKKLTLRYDRPADILYIDKIPPYPEQETEELGDDVITRLNPVTGEIENLQVLFFFTRLLREDLFELPVEVDLRVAD